MGAATSIFALVEPRSLPGPRFFPSSCGKFDRAVLCDICDEDENEGGGLRLLPGLPDDGTGSAAAFAAGAAEASSEGDDFAKDFKVFVTDEEDDEDDDTADLTAE